MLGHTMTVKMSSQFYIKAKMVQYRLTVFTIVVLGGIPLKGNSIVKS